MSTQDRYGSYATTTTCLRCAYIIFKLISPEGFSTKEAKQELEICDRTCRRMISAVKEVLEQFYGNDIELVYDKKLKRYHLVLLKSNFNIVNFPSI